MDSNNNARDRKIKQDTRAWAELVGTNYTTALRQTESPLAQGFLGERVSARQLINTLSDHPLVGAEDGEFVLGEAGSMQIHSGASTGPATSSNWPWSPTSCGCSLPSRREKLLRSAATR